MSSRARLLAERDASAAGSWHRHFEASLLAPQVAEPAAGPAPEDVARSEAVREAEAARQAFESAARLVRRLEAAMNEVAQFRAELLERIAAAADRTVARHLADGPAPPGRARSRRGGRHGARRARAVEQRHRAARAGEPARLRGAAGRRAIRRESSPASSPIPGSSPAAAAWSRASARSTPASTRSLVEISRALLESDEIPRRYHDARDHAARRRRGAAGRRRPVAARRPRDARRRPADRIRWTAGRRRLGVRDRSAHRPTAAGRGGGLSRHHHADGSARQDVRHRAGRPDRRPRRRGHRAGRSVAARPRHRRAGAAARRAPRSGRRAATRCTRRP